MPRSSKNGDSNKSMKYADPLGVSLNPLRERFELSPLSNTVFIVDDEADIRRSLEILVASIGLAVETFATAKDFLQRYDSQAPGCLILDVRLPGMTGLELQKELSARGTCPPIIFISGHGDVALASEALRAGAVDFIQKPFAAEALLRRVREAIALDQERRRKHTLARDAEGRLPTLTDREREIMQLLAAGDSTKQIAQGLSISPKTVDHHRAKVLEKMNVDNPTQLARLLALLE